MAAFGFTAPYQRFTTIFPAVLALGMQILCSKALGRGELREVNGIFSLAAAAALALMIFLTGATFLFAEQIADLLGTSESLGSIRSLTIDYLKAFRVIIKSAQVIIRLRDDCRPFDPKKQAELFNPEDPASHIGIRLVRKMATEFDYVNVLKLNNLLIKI